MSARGEARILVVDDEADLRDLVAHFLGRRGLAVAEAENGAAMRARLAAERFDLIVLDINMPDESGLDLLTWLRASGDDVPVVMLTAREALEDRLTGLGRGADDYVTKPFEPRELLARIRAVLRRIPQKQRTTSPAPVPSAAIDLGRGRFDPATGKLTANPGGDEIPLTTGELQLLRVMLRHANMPLARNRLEELALGAVGGAGSRAIDAHVYRLRQKLEPDPAQPQVLRTVRGAGYLLTPGPSPR